MDLADDNLNFKLKGIKCAHGKADLMTLMTYNAMGKEYTGRMLNKTLNKAYSEHILSLSISSTKKEKTKKVVLEVMVNVKG